MLEAGTGGHDGTIAPPPMPMPSRPDRRPADPAWEDAVLAARILACVPAALGGVHVTARASPIRDRWMAFARACLPATTPVRRITPSVSAGRLIGGVDIAATLAKGQPVREPGLLETIADGCLVLAMAERLSPDTAGIIARAMDDAAPDNAGFGLIALDESDGEDDDHHLPSAIADRLALRIRLDGIALRDAVAPPAQLPFVDAEQLANIAIEDQLMQALVSATAMLRGSSMRAPFQALLIARICAALDGRSAVSADDVVTAIRLSCGAMVQQPDAETGPDNSADDATSDPPPSQDRSDEDRDADETDQTPPDFDPELLNDILVSATKSAKLDLEAFHKPQIMRTRNDSAAGKSGALRKGAQRGRPAGLVARPPYPGARANVTATLRTAAPWQAIRRRTRGLPQWQPGERLDVRPSDFRYTRYAHNTESTAIFAVDASGSTALERLGEAKGCVELLLADCYVRRDQVALIAFRGEAAQVLLEPTRSLVRAKRSLTALPGGGPTPLADGMRQALDVAERVRRRGQSPLIVLMTDGKGNVALDGTQDRAAARTDAEEIGRQCAMLGTRAVIIDIARRPREAARSLATTMRADYVALPRADARAMSDVVSGYLEANG